MIVDTNVLSSVFNKNIERQAIARDFLSRLGIIKTSVIVLYEIEYGLVRSGSMKSLASFKILAQRSVRAYPVDEEIALLAANMRAEQEAIGQTLHIEDLLIGATAKALGVPVATANEKDFAPWQIEIVNPFKDVAGKAKK
ncbi:MAG TPA: type II toxin-antitoxin system VapC family toxin [Oligoflexus sp.]|uniref:type II toxin-antitoxin system VapC family toxin n=1 Tax=Oligoflexus sp. TaxID=1971216 RepID=UPI002D4B8168|nr:type II toxin-antitoxin system VapC family toxin [Oligoflexus sp.]HYX39826.1 type II toxin-antitoxin system VapC family toxin [Oligoflexus sp.]HYX39829.1 type II toxin-antitoxin system VapC family toxin [Oligoflexus sp.]